MLLPKYGKSYTDMSNSSQNSSETLTQLLDRVSFVEEKGYYKISPEAFQFFLRKAKEEETQRCLEAIDAEPEFEDEMSEALILHVISDMEEAFRKVAKLIKNNIINRIQDGTIRHLSGE